MDDRITPDEAAVVLGIRPHSVRYLIRKNRLKATKWGRSYLILRGDLKRIRYGKSGPKPKSDTH